MQNFDFPPRESIEEALKKSKAESKALGKLSDMLLAADLADDDLTENDKIRSRIKLAINRIEEKTDIFLELAGPNAGGDDKELYPMRKEVLDYMRLMSIGIDSFVEERFSIEE